MKAHIVQADIFPGRRNMLVNKIKYRKVWDRALTITMKEPTEIHMKSIDFHHKLESPAKIFQDIC